MANNKPFVVSITPDTNAYGDGDVIGGALTFASVGTPAANSGLITHVTISDDDAEGTDCDLWLFDATPTAIADNAALALTMADFANLIGIVSVAAEDFTSNNSLKVAHVALTNPIPFYKSSIYGYLATSGTTPTYASSKTIHIKLHVNGE